MAEYKPMDCESIIKYIKELNLETFDENADLTAKEIGDGNLNLVFRVKDSNTGKSVIIKQALPYLRVAGEGWKLTVERNRIEAEAMIEQDEACPNSVPKVYYHDKDYNLYVAEDLGNMDMLRTGLMNMKKYPKFPNQIGKFLSRNLFYTSDLGLGAVAKKSLVSKFINPELCDITEKLVLTDPYMDAESNDINPEIMDEVKNMWGRKDFILEVTKLKNIFMTKAEGLLHGDLHTGSIFITEDDMRVFDTEFAFYGPYGYDIGLLFANFILNYISWEGREDRSKEEIREFRKYLLDAIEEIWHEFEKDLKEIWEKDSKEISSTVEGYKEYYINNLLQETVGFSACEVMRRIVGMAHVPDLDILKDLKQKAKAQSLGLKIGQEMVMRRNKISNIEDLSALILELTK
ncbi:S-methyl-5-thioribose kinase [Clostridium sporogenes]|uniref:S-methyl-5-thioribose kinase n=2 Tax=Clostridium TaxID=1485 RepID=A0AAE4Z406_CLOSG|nr:MULTISPECIES: S-methyl-5-thioribose kinase [Clostridium]MBE6076579.1 S-methyl-5-thioribose kinase [Clostridium lundense]MDU2833809.1 S-methyl-5-thioribose kinase [Clostridium botulinum]EDU37541.1 S-methyl-5-thioribose kinase [Clostridium sporogenes ATCC 15579]KIS23259.1 methylthioribose kinase [Clostridium botulinum B2 450]MCW6095261.1 S-methyl-5-thioribose kinase [Clostridium sporogenes]